MNTRLFAGCCLRFKWGAGDEHRTRVLSVGSNRGNGERETS
jgi:hypothetical protein